MKKLINFLFVVVCVIMTTACESELKDMAYSYTNKSNGDVTVIRLYKGGNVLINKFTKWDVEDKDEIYMYKGRHIIGASYSRIDSIINIKNEYEVFDKIIVQKDGGIRYKADVYRPDKRFKDIKPVGKYGGKSYESKGDDGNMYMCFIDEKTVLLATEGGLDYYDYEISNGKILISGKNLIFKPEGDNYLVLESNWTSLVMKYKGMVDDYELWSYILSDFERDF